MLRKIVTRLYDRFADSEEVQVYKMLHTRGFAPDAIIDVGAYEGHWSTTARSIFGPIPTLMVDAQAGKDAALRRCSDAYEDWTHEIALLGSEDGNEVSFYEMETGSSMMPERSDVSRKEVRIKTRRLDTLAAELPGRNLFLKLNVQGAELEVLKGAPETLKRAGLVQLETAVLSYNEGAPSMREVLAFMEERGLSPIDIAGRVRIKNMLIQIDLLFAPTGGALRPDYFEWETATSAIRSPS